LDEAEADGAAVAFAEALAVTVELAVELVVAEALTAADALVVAAVAAVFLVGSAQAAAINANASRNEIFVIISEEKHVSGQGSSLFTARDRHYISLS